MNVNEDIMKRIESMLASGQASETTRRPPVPEESPTEQRLSEKQFQADVVKYAKRQGWNLIYHAYDSRRSASGFPDLVLVRERVVWAELKAEDGKQTNEQVDWQNGLQAADAEYYLWRPTDWPEIMEVLK